MKLVHKCAWKTHCLEKLHITESGGLSIGGENCRPPARPGAHAPGTLVTCRQTAFVCGWCGARRFVLPRIARDLPEVLPTPVL